MSILSDDEYAKGLRPSPIDAVIERVKTLSAENAALRMALREARREALEEAAGICDRFADRQMHPAECAAAIRALIDKGEA